jgi:hypothetical protein
MKPVEFVIRGGGSLEAETVRAYATRRLSFGLHRFEHRIRAITVRLVDVNGPRKGTDSRCSMVADLEDGHRIFVGATTAWPFASITRAASRLVEALRREFDRSANHRQRTAQDVSR